MNEKLVKNNRVELLAMPNDPHPVPIGTKGTVMDNGVDVGGIIYSMQWDNGSTLNLIDGVDSWKKL